MTVEGFAPGTLSWGLGIEDTCVYSADGTPMLDEHALTQHDRLWRDDLRQVKDLGATFLRYGVGWPAVHVARGRFDWSAFDRAVDECQRLDIAIVADLVHYGTPAWLDGSFCAPEYPEVYAEYVRAFGERYRGAVAHVTPVNEPLTTASFCGLRGVWPPYGTGWQGWVDVTVAIADGIVRGVHELREAAPEIGIVHVEASSDFFTEDPVLADDVAFHTRLGWLPTDLILGRVGENHDLSDWLQRHGVGDDVLARLRARPADFDIMGVNYYPDLTPRLLESVEGRVIQQTYDRGRDGLETALRGFAERYGKPLLITETSIEGDDARRARWMADAADAVRELAADGLDVRGLTWWPLFDFIDWSWASGGKYVEEFQDKGLIERADANAEDGFLRRMGLIRLDRPADGALTRRRTPAADAYADAAKSPGATAGDPGA